MLKQNNKIFTRKRQNGIYDTPYKTAYHMVQIVLPFIRENSRILDPAAGNGIFIRALLDEKVNTNSIYAFDIDESKISKISNLGVKVKCIDTLLNDYPKMDIIIGNPPFKSIRNSNYIKKHKLRLQKLYGSIGIYNLYTMFVLNALWHLNDNGIMCFILEDAFLTNRYYKLFREYLLNNSTIIEIKLAPWNLFHTSKADVRTCIITLQKKKLSEVEENDHQTRLIDRLISENEYNNPPKIQLISQNLYRKMPDFKFVVGISSNIIKIIQESSLKFGNIAKGGTGISTGNDRKYLKSEINIENNPDWVGFYKSGSRKPYYYITPYFIEKNYRKNAKLDPKNFLIRNEQYYFKEGITCSSVGRKFSAAYLPPGNLFGVNANFFFDKREDIFYNLGFLNSKITLYISRKVLSRSNIIATSFIKELPYKMPSKKEKREVVLLVKQIIDSLYSNPSYDFSEEQSRIDEIFFTIYKISITDKDEILDFCNNILKRI